MIEQPHSYFFATQNKMTYCTWLMPYLIFNFSHCNCNYTVVLLMSLLMSFIDDTCNCKPSIWWANDVILYYLDELIYLGPKICCGNFWFKSKLGWVLLSLEL